MTLSRLFLLASLAALLAAQSTTPPDATRQDSPIVGIWSGTATAGGATGTLAFDIRKLPDGIGLYMTLPRLHAWRMPVDYVTAHEDGTWSVPSWHITLRRDGDTLVGTYTDPRVRFELSRVPALPAETPVPEYPAGPEPDWTYDAGAPLWASLAQHEGTLYAADANGGTHAVRAADGSRVWRVEGGAPIYGAPLATSSALFVFDDAGVLRRLDRETGREIWRAELGADATARVLPDHNVFTFDFHSPAPVLHDGSIIVTTSNGVVHALDAESGSVQWKTDLGARVRATAAASDALVVVGTLDNHLVALDRGTGVERWRFEATGPITSAATFADGLVLFASRGAWITALDAASGTERWARFDWSSWIESDGVLANDGIYYVGSSDLRAVRALDPKSGATRWESDVLGWAWGTPALTRDTAFIGVAGPRTYVTKHAAGLVALDRRSGTVLWRRPVAPVADRFVSGYPGSVVISNGVLAAPNVKGTIEGFRLGPRTRR